MRPRLAVAGGIAAIALLGFVGFPGHTYLQSDTQIYVPMLEHIWDPSTYPGDLVAAKPHLSFTLYDEIALTLRRLLLAPFEISFQAQQLLYRAFQIAGVYLLARAFPLTRAQALTVAAIAGLGATILGPSVLWIEYEPVPRGFAIAFVFLAIGLAARGHWVWASLAASAGALYHAPTTVPFWICFLPCLAPRRQWTALVPPAGALLILLLASQFQAGVVERQHFFFSIDPELESLQRLRASYNWVSLWSPWLILQYLVLWTASLIAYRRVRPVAGAVFTLGLPILGILSVPASYLLLEKLKWGLMPQFQPARALLFVTAMASILTGAAGLRAVASKRWPEAALWCALALAIPLQGNLNRSLKPLETGDLIALESFAREHTPKDAMFAFPHAGKALYPGIFRARALRSVYVDWKAGGQVNYYKSLATEWWNRWQNPVPPEGLDYLILKKPDALPESVPIYENGSYAVYRAR